ncbi:MAG: LVIVD repeat-containing protein [Gemmatimonadota bacterium]
MGSANDRSQHTAGGGAPARRIAAACLVTGLLGAAACAPSATTDATATGQVRPLTSASSPAPDRDPREGLGAGLLDAEEAAWNLRVVSETPPPEAFVGVTNSDLAFTGHYAIQGNYNGFQVWDISDPASPVLVKGYVCPASQSDVSVYRNLLFVSGEGLGGRLDCGTEGVAESVSPDRLRGIRIFDISDIRNPVYVGNVQTCRGSHTHSVLVDPDDAENVYIYVSGSAPVRPAEELPGCSGERPNVNPSSALFRIEVIRVPLAHPEEAAIVSSPRIFEDLAAPPRHGPSEADLADIEKARARGAFVIELSGQPFVLPEQMTDPMLANAVKARGGTGEPTAADSAEVRRQLEASMARRRAARQGQGPPTGPTQCHDITLYPAIGLAGGACEGYGLLLDISDPVNPRRIAAVSDSNFSYWHSATFSNDGSRVLFSDEWGGGGGPKCRATDPREWGADAIFTVADGGMQFQSYYKLPAVQTSEENCVAHNGSLIPIPGRTVMVQAWYQGGVSVFDWTDPAHPVEIAFFDRGPVDATKMVGAGSWSAYWYNGVIVSSEIARGLDIFELEPSEFLTANEIEAARSVKFDYFNVQGQQEFVWPASFALARAYVDQLERSGGLPGARVARIRTALAGLEAASPAERRPALTRLATRLEQMAGESADGGKLRDLADTLRELAAG